MKQLFHRGMFWEGLRRLRVHGILALIVFTVFEAFPVITILLTEKINRIPTVEPIRFTEVHGALYVIPFIVPFVLMLTAIRFQTSRRDSDFYHSLPVTKVGICLSFFAAVAVWCAAVVLGSSLVMAILVIIVDISLLSITDVLLCVFGSLAACLFVATVTLFASTLSGSMLTTVAFTGMIVFGPRGAAALLVSLALNHNDLIPYVDGSEFYESLLFGRYDSVTAWLVTLFGTAILLAFAVWLANRRPSETAGSSAVSAGVQTFMRILFAMGCSIPAIVTIYEERFSDSLIFTLVFVIIAYFLFEIITTKTVKNLIKTIPWLGVVALLNAVCIFAMHGINHYVYSVCPTPDQISSVTVVWLGEGINIQGETVPYILYNESTGMLEVQEVDRLKILEEYRNDFGTNNEGNKVRLTDEASKTAVSDALKFSIPYAKISAYPDNQDCPVYRLQVIIRTSNSVLERYVWVTQDQFDVLMTAIDRQDPIPAHHQYVTADTK